jgi:hypothetical protein
VPTVDVSTLPKAEGPAASPAPTQPGAPSLANAPGPR